MKKSGDAIRGLDFIRWHDKPKDKPPFHFNALAWAILIGMVAFFWWVIADAMVMN